VTRGPVPTTVLLIALLSLGACARPTPLAPQYAHTAIDPRTSAIDERKDEVLRQLAVCESGGYGDSDRPIYGGRGSYVGRFQFATRTIINYVKEMDGRQLSSQEALLLGHDYRQAAELAKYVIFERGHYWNWPACSRKIGLANQVADIKSM
jgi:hypothetical protein